MLEEIENIEDTLEMMDVEDLGKEFNDAEISYIEEVLPLQDEDILVDRIDELCGQEPPKAIDSNKDIAALIEPIIKDIDPVFLEAPSDSVQIEEASEMMKDVEGLSYDEWVELSFEERVDVLQNVEIGVAEIAHRPAREINTALMGEKKYGYFDPNNNGIMLNSRYIKSDSFMDYKECLDTVLHEGRHAYQYYNLTEREVHPREGDLTNWKANEFEFGYQDAKTCGYKAYWMQPQECDARAFAEDVLKHYFEK